MNVFVLLNWEPYEGGDFEGIGTESEMKELAEKRRQEGEWPKHFKLIDVANNRVCFGNESEDGLGLVWGEYQSR